MMLRQKEERGRNAPDPNTSVQNRKEAPFIHKKESVNCVVCAAELTLALIFPHEFGPFSENFAQRTFVCDPAAHPSSEGTAVEMPLSGEASGEGEDGCHCEGEGGGRQDSAGVS